ncbi:MAG: RNA polymerase sigma factor [Ginsengibacter sp.]
MSTPEFNQLLSGNTDFLKPYAFKLTSDKDDAKDLLQETLCRALINKEKYNFGTNIKAWLYTIMRNIFINDYRKKIRQNVVPDNSENSFLLNYSLHTITNMAESDLKVKEIKASIYKLPGIFKNPFLLYFEGYKYHEIAKMLDEPLGTIKSRIYFARKLLKEEISRYN